MISTWMFHAASFGFNAFVVYYSTKMAVPTKMPIEMPHLGHCWWQYLTAWNMVLQVCYFAICLVDDFLQGAHRKALVEAKEKVRGARDTLFQSLVLPLCMSVFTIFWGAYAYDRQVIFPLQLDAVIPTWLNHMIHTTILIFPWAELFICRRPFAHFKTRYFYGLMPMMLYNFIIMVAALWQGYWVYPMLGLMTPFQRALFFCLTYTIFTTAYVIGCKANTKLCGYNLKDAAGNCHRFLVKKKLYTE